MSQPVAQHSVPAASGRTGRRGHGNPWLTLVAVALGVIMVTLDTTVVAIANPAISRDLGASLSDLQWVTNGYLLALAVSLITAGKLGDRLGHKPVFLIGVVGFALASAGIGLSRDIGLMIALRVIQGVFGAMLQPTALGLLRAAFPAERLNLAIGIWSACIAASTAAKPDRGRPARPAHQLGVGVLHQRPGRRRRPGGRRPVPAERPRRRPGFLLRHPRHPAAVRHAVHARVGRDQGAVVRLGRREDAGVPGRGRRAARRLRRARVHGPRAAAAARAVPVRPAVGGGRADDAHGLRDVRRDVLPDLLPAERPPAVPRADRRTAAADDARDDGGLARGRMG